MPIPFSHKFHFHPLLPFPQIAYPNFTTPHGCGESYTKDLLERENKLRVSYKLAPLAYNATISAWAQQWADHLAAQNGHLEFRKESNGNPYPDYYGEAVFTWQRPPEPELVIKKLAYDSFEEYKASDHWVYVLEVGA